MKLMNFSEYDKAVMEGGHELVTPAESVGTDFDFIHSLYESKFYLYTGNVANIDYRDLANFAFVGLLAVYVLYQESHSRASASNYADRSIRWDMTGKFRSKRINASDLYITWQSILDYEHSMIAGKLKHTPEEEIIKYRFKNRTLLPDLRRLLVDMKTYQLSTKDAWTGRFWFKVSQALYIEDSNLLNLRRKVQNWHNLKKSEKIYVISRLNLWFGLHGKQFDLYPLINDLARAKDID